MSLLVTASSRIAAAAVCRAQRTAVVLFTTRHRRYAMSAITASMLSLTVEQLR